MATSTRPQKLYLADHFVVAAGSVLFRRSPENVLEICLLFEKIKSEWLLPKGRKDQGESIETAALRETFEETGYKCELMPIRMATRAPAPGINGEDTVVAADGITEPFATTVRDVGPERGVKIIWWYITRLKEGVTEKVENTQTEWEQFVSSFVEADAAVSRLTYEDDRTLVRKALEIVRNGTM